MLWIEACTAACRTSKASASDVRSNSRFWSAAYDADRSNVDDN